jgi:hypothetical protein
VAMSWALGSYEISSMPVIFSFGISTPGMGVAAFMTSKPVLRLAASVSHQAVVTAGVGRGSRSEER